MLTALNSDSPLQALMLLVMISFDGSVFTTNPPVPASMAFLPCGVGEPADPFGGPNSIAFRMTGTGSRDVAPCGKLFTEPTALRA